MSNHTQNFEERKKNNTAEIYFEEFAKNKNLIYEKFGFDQLNSGIKGRDFNKIPKFIRNRPDYIVISNKARFVEVKGGTDIIRMKESDLESYEKWNKKMDVYYFFYLSHYNTHRWKKHTEVMELIKKCDKGQFHDHTKYDKKIYYKIDWILL